MSGAQLLPYWQEGVDGSTLTSIKVGGPVRFLARPRTSNELAETVEQATRQGLTLRVLGGGSDLLLSDQGLDGLLLRPQLTGMAVIDRSQPEQYEQLLALPIAPASPRYRKGSGQAFLDLEERAGEEGEPAFLRLEAGIPWGQAVTYSLQQRLVGLHLFARIPCQVGGAVYNNIHAQDHLLSEFIVQVEAYDPAQGRAQLHAAPELDFGYDQSAFHTNGQIITAVTLRLPRVSVEEAEACRQQYLDWTRRKVAVQPSGPNCGSVFQNLAPEQAAGLGEEAVAAAWYIDQCGLKGVAVGAMQVYPGHANFIINTGGGSQAQFIELVALVRQRVYHRFGFWLEPEAICWDSRGNRIPWEKSPSAATC